MNQRVEAWKVFAERDLCAAELLFEHGQWDTCVFHAQQAAEKMVKALHISELGDPVPKVHSVEKLAQNLGAPSDIVDRATDLTAEYIASRYPDTFMLVVYTKDDARARLEDARAVCDWALGRILNG
jgi:HEPN domain-containing protein